jgi:hypothetical protein
VFKLPLDLDLEISLKLIVQQAISEMICKKLKIPELLLRSVEYIPTYKKGADDQKVVNNLYIRLLAQNNFKVITYSEIIQSGATCQEVIEFLLFSGSRKLTTKEFFNSENL